MRRYPKLTFFCLTSSVFAMGLSDMSYALGLGDISLNSYLFQPIAADVQLQSLEQDVDLSSVKVQIASAEAFEKAGIDRPYFLNNFQFEVIKDKQDKPVIKISSFEPVGDPFVTFLLEARWPSGRVIKEYTLLLDPVDFNYAKQQQQNYQGLKQPQKFVAKPSKKIKSVKKKEKSKQKIAANSKIDNNKSPVTNNHYGPTKADDSLWSISKSLVKGKSVKIQQAMIAVAKKNPTAFKNGNINLLKKGTTLSLPSEEEMMILSYNQAKAEVIRHQEALKLNKPINYANKSALATNVKIKPDNVVASAQSPKSQYKPLKLLVPQVEEIGELVQEDPKEFQQAKKLAKMRKMELEKLKSQLLVAEESVDTLTMSNTSLKEASKNMQTENQQLLMTLQAKELELEILRKQLQERSQLAKVDAEDEVTEIASIDQALEEDAVLMPENATPQNVKAIKASMGSNISQATKAQQQPEGTAVKDLTKSNNLQDNSSSNWLYILLVLILGSSAAAISYIRRNGINLSEAISLPEGFSFKDFDIKELFAKKEYMPIKVETVTTDADIESNDSFNVNDAFSVFDEKDSTVNQISSSDQVLSENTLSQNIDNEKNIAILQEVELLIANEQFNSAEIALKEMIEKDAYNWIAHGKLCEIYYLSDQKSLLQAHKNTLPQSFKERAPDVWEKLQGFLNDVKVDVNSSTQPENNHDEQNEINLTDKDNLENNHQINYEAVKENIEAVSITPEDKQPSNQELESLSSAPNEELSHEIEFESIAIDSEAEESVTEDELAKNYLDPNQKDENDNKLALAQAYIDLEDENGAIEHLNEVLSDGTSAQKAKAKFLLDEIKGKF